MEKRSVFLPLAVVFLTNALCAFLEFQIITIEHFETIRSFTLNYMIIIVWVIYLSIFSSISFRFPTKKYGNKANILKGFLTIPLVFLTYTFLVPKYLSHINLVRINGQWMYNLDYTDPVGLLFFLFVSAGLFMQSWFYWRQVFLQTKENRKQKIMALGVVQTLSALASVFYFIIYTQNNPTPFLASLVVSINTIFVAWIFTDFKLKKISTSIAFNDILNSMSSMLIILDKQLKIVHVNQESKSKLQLENSNFEGAPVYKLIRKFKIENWKAISDLIFKCRQNSENNVITKIVVGELTYFISVNIKPQYSKSNNLVGYIMLGTDVTELNAQKNEIQQHTRVLERTNKELERFAYIASHDLKTPLRSVISFLDLIERKIVKYEDKDLKEFVYLARQGASQMHHLIRDILEFSKVDKIGTVAKQIDLNETLFEICYSLQPTISDKKGEIFVSELPRIHAEKTHMHQLFANLIENGFKYNKGDKPEIKINHRLENDRHIFAVSDNGIGVEPQYFNQIFEMFKRLHTNPEHEGSGIGLSICKKIVDLYQGEIWLESKINEGTTFFFTLADQD